jgi:hypothetical protein
MKSNRYRVRRANLTHAEFVRDYLSPLHPVILTDATTHWVALTKWTPAFFKEHYGTLSLKIDDQSYIMRDFVDLILTSDSAHPAPYLHNQALEGELSGLLADILPLPHYVSPNWFENKLFPSKHSFTSLELYIGGQGAKFPVLHYDTWHTHAFLMQVYGDKEYTIYAPDQEAYLYPGAEKALNKSRVNDIENPDLEQFPLFTKATPIHCFLHPGETLFVPAGWWHTARILTPSITISANTVNTTNWVQFTQDYSGSVARHRSRTYSYALRLYLYALGWLAPFMDFL